MYVTYDALTVDSIIYTMSSLYIFTLYLAIAMISFFSRVLFQIFGVDIVGKTWFNNGGPKCRVFPRHCRVFMSWDARLKWKITIFEFLGQNLYFLHSGTVDTKLRKNIWTGFDWYFRPLQSLHISKCSFFMKNVNFRFFLPPLKYFLVKLLSSTPGDSWYEAKKKYLDWFCLILW